jgi:hypothetical protein
MGGAFVFTPLDHKGIALDGQIRSWRELNVEPIDAEAFVRSALTNSSPRCRFTTSGAAIGHGVECVKPDCPFAGAVERIEHLVVAVEVRVAGRRISAV